MVHLANTPMKDFPLVSVILPVYNTEKYVAESIQSVLNQTHKNIEIIAINDGSIDGSLDVLKQFGNKLILIDCDQNQGIAAARNEGLKKAKGDFIALMDADDLWEPEKVETQINQFRENPELDISFSYMKCFLSPDLSVEIKAIRRCPPDPMPGQVSATALIKSESFWKVGPFDPTWRVGEFIDWMTKANALKLNHATLPQAFLLRRIHETNTGVTERPARADYLKIVKAALDRKRSS